MTSAPTLPDVFASVFAGLEELSHEGPYAIFHECFGCGPRHEIGLRIRCFRGDGEVLSPIIVPARYAGPPGAAHGGIVAAYLDEVLAGAALGHTGRAYVTGELSVRYVKPTPVERPLLGRGRARHGAARYLELEGTLEDLATGEVTARATGRFFPIPAEGGRSRPPSIMTRAGTSGTTGSRAEASRGSRAT
jgi:acyl-coenzyme A thioesterase PaaI-like protein